ncbi:MAG: FAD-dependent oxidoreductase [Candidatus Latescibacterota bacterium]
MKCDCAVVGAGSGGIGAALAAARLGLHTVLVEKADRIGGTAVRRGVHCWEMGAGGTGIPFDIYRRLKRMPNAVGIYSIGRHFLWHDPASEEPEYPGGETIIDPERRYADTLRRHGARSMKEDEAFCREQWHGVPFEPDAYCRAVEQMLAETGRCRLLKNVAFSDVDTDGAHISSLTLSNGECLVADTYVDATGDGLLAAACGYEQLIGQEAHDRFGEPSAPEEPTHHVNGVTLIFRVRPTHAPGIEPLPAGISEECWWEHRFPFVSVNHYPCGDLNINMLPTMEGGAFARLESSAAYQACRRRVLAQWHHLQKIFPEFQGYRLTWVAPELGVRESRRIAGEYVLTEHDLSAGLSGQIHEDLICIADHAMDTHGASTGRPGCGGVKSPYGVPFRCLIPKGFDNLLIACRAASFSSLAASSCRLSRTMMQLGQAAGTAATLAKALHVDLPNVPPDRLREKLREQHVQLEWPPTDSLQIYLSDEDQR